MPSAVKPSTIDCPSCGKDNFALQLRCDGCGAYIRDRVPALNLFATLWGMIEAPATTALRIGRSEQKNYTYLIFAATGPLIFAAALFIARIGDTTWPFGYMMAAIVIVGPLFGLLLFPLTALWMSAVLRMSYGLRAGYRASASFLAWSLTPLMWASLLLLPLLLGIFGVILFSTNPAPWDMLPLPFWSLGGICVLAFPWSVLLLPVGFRVYGPDYSGLLLRQLLVWLLPVVAVSATAVLLRFLA
jgi:hypothetical protein